MLTGFHRRGLANRLILTNETWHLLLFVVYISISLVGCFPRHLFVYVYSMNKRLPSVGAPGFCPVWLCIPCLFFFFLSFSFGSLWRIFMSVGFICTTWYIHCTKKGKCSFVENRCVKWFSGPFSLVNWLLLIRSGETFGASSQLSTWLSSFLEVACPVKSRRTFIDDFIESFFTIMVYDVFSVTFCWTPAQVNLLFKRPWRHIVGLWVIWKRF